MEIYIGVEEDETKSQLMRKQTSEPISKRSRTALQCSTTVKTSHGPESRKVNEGEREINRRDRKSVV